MFGFGKKDPLNWVDNFSHWSVGLSNEEFDFLDKKGCREIVCSLFDIINESNCVNGLIYMVNDTLETEKFPALNNLVELLAQKDVTHNYDSSTQNIALGGIKYFIGAPKKLFDVADKVTNTTLIAYFLEVISDLLVKNKSKIDPKITEYGWYFSTVKFVEYFYSAKKQTFEEKKCYYDRINFGHIRLYGYTKKSADAYIFGKSNDFSVPLVEEHFLGILLNKDYLKENIKFDYSNHGGLNVGFIKVEQSVWDAGIRLTKPEVYKSLKPLFDTFVEYYNTLYKLDMDPCFDHEESHEGINLSNSSTTMCPAWYKDYELKTVNLFYSIAFFKTLNNLYKLHSELFNGFKINEKTQEVYSRSLEFYKNNKSISCEEFVELTNLLDLIR